MGTKGDDFFGGLFDFNGDGKTDLGEQFLAYQIFEQTMRDNSDDEDLDDDYDDDYDDVNLTDDADDYLPYIPQQTSIPSKQASTTIPPVTEPPPKELTLPEYKERRAAFVRECVISTVLALLLGVFPGVGIIYAAITSYDSKNSASGFVLMLFIFSGLLILWAVTKGMFAGIPDKYQQLQKEKETCLANATDEELSLRKRKTKRTKVVTFSILGAGILILIAVSAISHSRTAAIYNDALDQVASGDYEQAALTLRQIEEDGYKDTRSLLLLCEAHKEYDSDRAIDAYYTMQDARFYHMPADQTEKIDSFRKTLQSEYDAYIHEQAERSRKEYERIQSLPFPSVGQYVSKSQLDQMHWEGNDNKTCDVHTTKYLYTSGGGEKYRLWISDYNCIKKVVKLLSSHSSGPSTVKSGTGGLNNEPSVDGFSHPEDFYDWYWDDFFDYEDAEDYYYSHGGK